MNDNQKLYKERTIQAAEKSLYKQKYVSAIDVLIEMNLLQPVHVNDWRKGKIPCLEQVIQGNLKKISFYMKCFHAWAKEKGLKSSQTVYLARTSGPKRELRFSKSGNPKIEQAYRTHYISKILSETKQKKIQEKLNKPPKLVVFRIVRDTQCMKCKKELFKGNFLFVEAGQPLCLHCANLSELEFLPRGNAKLTRLANKEQPQSIVVVEFSRSRKRYERQGILIDKSSLEKVKLTLENDENEQNLTIVHEKKGF